MKTSISTLVSKASIVLAVFAASPFLRAGNVGEQPGTVLSSSDVIRVNKVGDYVEIGTYQIQVSTKFGRPSEQLTDGTWLYRNWKIRGSSLEGTVVVSFRDGRVSSLAFASPRGLEAILLADRAAKSKHVAANR